MEEGPIEALHDSDTASAVRLALAESAADIGTRAVAIMLNGGGDGLILLDAPFDVCCLLWDGCGGRPANMRDAEDGLPGLWGCAVGGLRGGVAEACGDKGSLGPAVVNIGKVPVNPGRGSVLVELVAYVNQMLNGSDVDVVDGGEVENDGLEDRELLVYDERLSPAWAGIIPRAVLY